MCTHQTVDVVLYACRCMHVYVYASTSTYMYVHVCICVLMCMVVQVNLCICTCICTIGQWPQGHLNNYPSGTPIQNQGPKRPTKSAEKKAQRAQHILQNYPKIYPKVGGAPKFGVYVWPFGPCVGPFGVLILNWGPAGIIHEDGHPLVYSDLRVVLK